MRYVSRCHVFIALCPVLNSPDGSATFSDYTWGLLVQYELRHKGLDTRIKRFQWN